MCGSRTHGHPKDRVGESCYFFIGLDLDWITGTFLGKCKIIWH